MNFQVSAMETNWSRISLLVSLNRITIKFPSLILNDAIEHSRHLQSHYKTKAVRLLLPFFIVTFIVSKAVTCSKVTLQSVNDLMEISKTIPLELVKPQD